MTPRALVNRIIPFSSVDGPGNRTALFFQGCNFRCTYCHNPETINLCNHCGLCVPVCPSGALRQEKGRVRWDKSLCTACDACLKACPRLSSPRTASYSPEELWTEIKGIRPFISGITCSGGECTLQAEFLTELFKLVKKEGDLTCFVDSNGGVPLPEGLLEAADQFMLDVKAWAPEEHETLTGRSPGTLRENLALLLERKKLYEVRTVVLPGIDNARTIRETARLIGSSCRYKLLPYRPFGVRAEGLAFHGETGPDAAEMERFKALAEEAGAREVLIAGTAL